jgi:hypothetical protein
MQEEDAVDSLQISMQYEPISSAIEAYEAFGAREAAWIKVELQPTLPLMARDRVSYRTARCYCDVLQLCASAHAWFTRACSERFDSEFF